jgi:hypothetical protein
VKLRTEVDEVFNGFGLNEIARLQYDAAAAHALLQAMKDWRSLPSHSHAEQWTPEWIEGRATALLRQWGFEPEKVTT